MKVPADSFFYVCQLNIDTFYKNFKTNCLESGIKKKIVELCIQETNKIENLKNWYSESDECFHHRYYLLNFLVLILLRKHCKWWTEKIIQNEKKKKFKNKNEKNARKMAIIKS